MNTELQQIQAKSNTHIWAVVSLICFACMSISFNFIGKWDNIIYVIAIFAVSSHITLFPIVTVLNAPAWAKFAGYTWAALDIILSVATLNGIPNETITP